MDRQIYSAVLSSLNQMVDIGQRTPGDQKTVFNQTGAPAEG